MLARLPAWPRPLHCFQSLLPLLQGEIQAHSGRPEVLQAGPPEIILEVWRFAFRQNERADYEGRSKITTQPGEC